MLSLHPAGQRGKSSSRKSARIGLAIAGGGPIGGMYELGDLRALDEALDGLDLTDIDSYVRVRSGALLTAGLDHRMSTADMFRPLINRTRDDPTVHTPHLLPPHTFPYAPK